MDRGSWQCLCHESGRKRLSSYRLATITHSHTQQQHHHEAPIKARVAADRTTTTTRRLHVDLSCRRRFRRIATVARVSCGNAVRTGIQLESLQRRFAILRRCAADLLGAVVEDDFAGWVGAVDIDR